MKNIGVTPRLTPKAKAYLRQKGYRLFDLSTSRQDIPSSLEAAIVRSDVRVNNDFLDRFPHLEVIVTATSGFDHLDLQSLEERRIPTMFCPQGNAQSAAEHTWALIFSATRKIVAGDNQIRQGSWDRSSLLGSELHRKTLGLIGFGRVGQRVQRLAQALSMRTVVYDPYVSAELIESCGAEKGNWQDVLAASDVLSFHVPLTHETHLMLSASDAPLIQKRPILINTSRGPVIDEGFLQRALKEGLIRWAGLDVFTEEPLGADSPWRFIPNCTLTPHIGATTEEALCKVSLEAAKKIVSFFESQKITNGLFSLVAGPIRTAAPWL